MITDITGLLLSVGFGLLGFFMLARFLLQVVRADFYNPLSQVIVRLTDAPLAPLRRVLPPWRNIDFVSLIAALAIETIYVVTMLTLRDAPMPGPLTLLFVAVLSVVRSVLNIYFVALLVGVAVSWIAPGTRNPAVTLTQQLTEPVLTPIRRLLPSLSGIDFSPMIALVAIMILRDIVLPRAGA